jgi:hypothetical protein
MLTPTVPRLRIALCPTCGIASARSGHAAATFTVLLKLNLRGHRADFDCPVPLLDETEFIQGTDVKQHLRSGDPHVHESDETLAARQRLGLVPVLSQEFDRPSSGLGALVSERRRLQRCL